MLAALPTQSDRWPPESCSPPSSAKGGIDPDARVDDLQHVYSGPVFLLLARLAMEALLKSESVRMRSSTVGASPSV